MKYSDFIVGTYFLQKLVLKWAFLFKENCVQILPIFFTEIYGALAFIDIINMPEKFQRNPWSKSL